MHYELIIAAALLFSPALAKNTKVFTEYLVDNPKELKDRAWQTMLWSKKCWFGRNAKLEIVICDRVIQRKPITVTAQVIKRNAVCGSYQKKAN